TLAVVSTVPAPTINCGRSFASLRMTSAAAAVRKVISTTGNPPAISASASGMTASGFSMAMTGTTPSSATRLTISSDIIRARECGEIWRISRENFECKDPQILSPRPIEPEIPKRVRIPHDAVAGAEQNVEVIGEFIEATNVDGAESFVIG